MKRKRTRCEQRIEKIVDGGDVPILFSGKSLADDVIEFKRQHRTRKVSLLFIGELFVTQDQTQSRFLRRIAKLGGKLGMLQQAACAGQRFAVYPDQADIPAEQSCFVP